MGSGGWVASIPFTPHKSHLVQSSGYTFISGVTSKLLNPCCPPALANLDPDILLYSPFGCGRLTLLSQLLKPFTAFCLSLGRAHPSLQEGLSRPSYSANNPRRSGESPLSGRPLDAEDAVDSWDVVGLLFLPECMAPSAALCKYILFLRISAPIHTPHWAAEMSDLPHQSLDWARWAESLCLSATVWLSLSCTGRTFYEDASVCVHAKSLQSCPTLCDPHGL